MNALEPVLQTVTVCVLTYRRPAMLAAALKSVGRQLGLGTLGVVADIVVIDNDPAGSGLETFNRVAKSLPFASRYVHEPRSGLAAARNRALEEALPSDYLAFLDDDEVAEPHWLAYLLEAMEEYTADIVTGPVLPNLDDAPQWVAAGKFFTPQHVPSGTPVAHVATDNVLMRRAVYLHLRFDERFRFTGGEDTHFFLRAKTAGFRIAWVDEARVTTWIPPERANAKWIIQRGFSDASRYTSARLMVHGGSRTHMARGLRATAGVAKALALLCVSPFDRTRFVAALRMFARSAGTFTALCGHRQHYYGERDV